MRNLLLSLLFLFLAFANATPSIFAAFLEPLSSLEETISEGNDTAPANELLKRQTGCASGYGSCSNLGAPGLCCKSNSVCSADSAGHVACCPINAACTGTIAGVIGASVTATSTVSFVFASTTTNPATTTGNFYFGTSTASVASVQGASAATYTRSTVSNSYYPFAYIPTTYTNAAACSSAYSSCQTDVASCTAALGGGIHGVTVSGPNGGVTITAITASLDPTAASQVCESLSSQACYGLQVAACAAFGTGTANSAARNRCGHVYGIGAGLAIGMAGQMLR
ncbi:hypothetical protein K432DRAFT_251 [Lepidopterella palustris CBS 459.81]|uniref:Uncharacterized protein n=1 Tax=Lepidopterella palustris CBS 459.81 TaxID=1314670 RepID=A0A8E2JL03_9PEZI|nr:hypothetical protein K432DRAFT_251 [Lepidopterella palustris CBS 459.81]